jgi:3-oxoacyl-ACP reductase-like protein
MKSFGEWKNRKQYFEFTATANAGTAPAAPATPAAPAAPATPAAPAAPAASAPETSDEAAPQANPMEDLSQTISQRMDYLFEKLGNLSFQKLIETQQAFNLKIQQLLAEKNKSAAQRGARANMQFARQMTRPKG